MQQVRALSWKWTGGFLLLAGMAGHTSRAKCSSPRHSSTIPSMVLYQYQACPFCCKTRAFLDYYDVSYQTVEVNPLFRREMKFSTYRKVPFVIAGDVQVRKNVLKAASVVDWTRLLSFEVNDSSLVISILRTCMVASCSVKEALDNYHEVQVTDEDGKELTEVANKYYVMYGDMARSSMSVDELRLETTTGP